MRGLRRVARQCRAAGPQTGRRCACWSSAGKGMLVDKPRVSTRRCPCGAYCLPARGGDSTPACKSRFADDCNALPTAAFMWASLSSLKIARRIADASDESPSAYATVATRCTSGRINAGPSCKASIGASTGAGSLITCSDLEGSPESACLSSPGRPGVSIGAKRRESFSSSSMAPATPPPD